MTETPNLPTLCKLRQFVLKSAVAIVLAFFTGFRDLSDTRRIDEIPESSPVREWLLFKNVGNSSSNHPNTAVFTHTYQHSIMKIKTGELLAAGLVRNREHRAPERAKILLAVRLVGRQSHAPAGGV